MNKKIYITENQFNELTYSKKLKKTHNKKHKPNNDTDFYYDDNKQKSKISKTEKAYSRKGKNKFKTCFYND